MSNLNLTIYELNFEEVERLMEDRFWYSYINWPDNYKIEGSENFKAWRMTLDELQAFIRNKVFTIYFLSYSVTHREARFGFVDEESKKEYQLSFSSSECYFGQFVTSKIRLTLDVERDVDEVSLIDDGSHDDIHFKLRLSTLVTWVRSYDS
jgi:hypothetical protein